MACGLPVVSTNVGAIPEVVKDGICGILIPPGDRRALKEAITILLTDEKLRRKLSHQAREYVLKNFSYNVVAEKTVKIYEMALS